MSKGRIHRTEKTAPSRKSCAGLHASPNGALGHAGSARWNVACSAIGSFLAGLPLDLSAALAHHHAP